MLLLWLCPIKIQKEIWAGLHFTITDYLSIVSTPLRILWTIPLRKFSYCIPPRYQTTLMSSATMPEITRHQLCPGHQGILRKFSQLHRQCFRHRWCQISGVLKHCWFCINGVSDITDSCSFFHVPLIRNWTWNELRDGATHGPYGIDSQRKNRGRESLAPCLFNIFDKSSLSSQLSRLLWVIVITVTVDHYLHETGLHCPLQAPQFLTTVSMCLIPGMSKLFH